MNNKTRRKSFTLIEMLIVVIIIGILATALIPRINDLQSRARDTKRRADLRNMATALQIYYMDNNSYVIPICNGWVTSERRNLHDCRRNDGSFYGDVQESDGSGGVLWQLVPNYLTESPVSPKHPNETYSYILRHAGASGNLLADYVYMKAVCNSNFKQQAVINARVEYPGDSDFYWTCPDGRGWNTLMGAGEKYGHVALYDGIRNGGKPKGENK